MTEISTPVEWTDHHGDVWQEHPVDPTLVRLVRFANCKPAAPNHYRPFAEIERLYGELVQTAGASITDEDVAEWQVDDDEEGGTGEVDPTERDAEVRYITEMNQQRIPGDEIVETYLNGKRTSVPPANELPEAKKLREAAADLENLTVMMKQAVLDLRANSERASRGGQTHASESLTDAYARAYYLRRELGRVVATLGVGVPASYQLRGIETSYRAQIAD